MAIYKYVLHHSGNTIPKWFLEVLGVWVSRLNGCDYCVQHHFAGMKRLLQDDPRADAIGAAIEALDIAATPASREARARLYSSCWREPGLPQQRVWIAVAWFARPRSCDGLCHAAMRTLHLKPCSNSVASRSPHSVALTCVLRSVACPRWWTVSSPAAQQWPPGN